MVEQDDRKQPRKRKLKQQAGATGASNAGQHEPLLRLLIFDNGFGSDGELTHITFEL
jgi:hypothetical protein